MLYEWNRRSVLPSDLQSDAARMGQDFEINGSDVGRRTISTQTEDFKDLNCCSREIERSHCDSFKPAGGKVR